MKRPRQPLPDKTQIFIPDRPLGDTKVMRGIANQYLASRRPNAHGVTWGLVPLLDGVYWVKHGNDKVMAVYGYWEFELLENSDD